MCHAPTNLSIVLLESSRFCFRGSGVLLGFRGFARKRLDIITGKARTFRFSCARIERDAGLGV